MTGETTVLPSAPVAGPTTNGLWEALYTARAVRRLHPDPVPLELLSRLVEAGTHAPTDSYSQRWRFVVVDDPATMAELGDLHEAIFESAERRDRLVGLPEAIVDSIRTLGRGLAKVPALILVGGEGAPQGERPAAHFRTFYGGLFPAVQNILLAARGLGLGATLTTLLVAGAEDEVRDLLGIPPTVTLVAAVPIGWPRGRHGRPWRRPVPEVAHHGRWGVPLPAPGTRGTGTPDAPAARS